MSRTRTAVATTGRELQEGSSANATAFRWERTAGSRPHVARGGRYGVGDGRVGVAQLAAPQDEENRGVRDRLLDQRLQAGRRSSSREKHDRRPDVGD